MFVIQRPSSKLLTVRLGFYLFTAVCLLLLASLHTDEEQNLCILIEAVLGGLFLLMAIFLYFFSPEHDEHWVEKITLFCVMGIAAWMLGVDEGMFYLIFIVPAYVYLIFDFKKATAAVLGFSLIVMYISWQSHPFIRVITILFAYFSIVALVGIFAFVNERHNQFLRRTLNMDDNVPAYNELQLSMDLDKEIPRADRQGSSLAYITLSFGGAKRLPNQHLPELIKVATDVGRYLRLSDSLYLIEPCHFVVLLAGGDESDMQGVFQQIQSKKADFLALNYSIELHFYHQEDDTESLLQKIKGHLYAV